LVEHRAPNSKPEWIADLLERLCWTLDEQTSGEILATLTKWLGGEDRDRVAVALALEEFYLAESPDALARIYDELCNRFPEFRERCDAILLGWRGQHLEMKNGEQAGDGDAPQRPCSAPL